jgi:hypothetical protein
VLLQKSNKKDRSPLVVDRPVTKKASSDLSRRKLSVSLCFDKSNLRQAARTEADKSGQKRTFFPDYERKTAYFQDRIQSFGKSNIGRHAHVDETQYSICFDRDIPGFTIPGFSQTNEGTDFWCAFMEHRDINQNTMVAMITSKAILLAEISIPGQGWSEPFQWQPMKLPWSTLPKTAETLGSESITQTGIHITSQEPVSVYIHQYFGMRSEAAVVLPVETLGRAYYVMSYFGVKLPVGTFPSEFIVVAKEDETTINIELSDDTRGGRRRRSTFTISLDSGRNLPGTGCRGADDLTGTLITGDKAFAIFGGARWTQVPSNCEFRDNLLEQMYPIDAYGRQFVTVPNASVNFDVFRILASEDNTRVEVRGATDAVYELDAGEFVEYRSSVSSYIFGDKPILVAQYNVGSNVMGIPWEIPPWYS